MLDGLVFLPVSDVSAGMQYLRTNILNINDFLDALVTYFDSTYVTSPGVYDQLLGLSAINLILSYV